MPAVLDLKLSAEIVASLPRTVLGCAGRMIFRSAWLVVVCPLYFGPDHWRRNSVEW